LGSNLRCWFHLGGILQQKISSAGQEEPPDVMCWFSTVSNITLSPLW
jgi:hypothetical protein